MATRTHVGAVALLDTFVVPFLHACMFMKSDICFTVLNYNLV